MDVGAELRDARERRGLSLEQIAQTTKISAGILRTIERNDVEKLPHRVFLRGFLKAYALEVDLDPGEVVDRYLGQFEPVAEVQDTATSEDVPTAHDVQEVTDVEHRHLRPARVRSLAIVTMLSATAVVSYYATARWHGPAAATRTTGAAVSAQTVPLPDATDIQAGPAETGTAGRVPPGAAAPDVAPLRLRIRARDVCGVSVMIDGTPVFSRRMQPGEVRAFEVPDEAVLQVDDPAAIGFSVNGVEALRLGPTGEPVTARITRQNYRDYLYQ